MRKGFIVALVVVAVAFVFFMITRREELIHQPVVTPPLDEEQIEEIKTKAAEEIVMEIEAFPPVEEIEYKGRGFSDWKHELEHSPSSLMRSEAARALHAFGPAAVPVLIEEIEKNEDIWIRRWSIGSLGEIGPMAKDAIPILMKVLEEEESALLREAAASSLGKMGPIAADAVPLLIKALEADEWNVRSEAARALGGIGPLAQDAIPILIELLDDESIVVRHNSRASLRKIRQR
ncbi:HEAT repeat domain-containing protein [candidate division NPL-UPA2 bacterium]|nr:HEAT repeat domain-containing protein [candidate division NPL-UPA2 bacterium]